MQNQWKTIRKSLDKIGPPQQLNIVYEAGPTGFALCRKLKKSGYECTVIAPSLIPRSSGDRVKTDRRDAEKLANLHRAGMLTSVVVPAEQIEALRDLVRFREASKKDEQRARLRLNKFLMRHDRQKPKDLKTNWTQLYFKWLGTLGFEQKGQQLTFDYMLAEVIHRRDRIQAVDGELKTLAKKLPKVARAVVKGLQALRGVAFITAVTLVSEIGDFTRFAHPTLLTGYAGAAPSEYSSGGTVRRGGITKTGNARLRRILGEAAWSYRHKPRTTHEIRKRQEGLSPHTVDTAWKCQKRLHARYLHLLQKGKHPNKVMGALSRELLSFAWAIAVDIQLQSERGEAVQPA